MLFTESLSLVGALGLVDCVSYMLPFQGFITNEIYFGLCKIMCVMCAYTWLYLPVEAKRGCWTCWRCLGVDMSRLIRVLGTELGPSARSLSSLKDWAIFPAPKIVCVLIFNIFCAPGFFCLMNASSVSATLAVSQGCCFFKLPEVAGWVLGTGFCTQWHGWVWMSVCLLTDICCVRVPLVFWDSMEYVCGRICCYHQSLLFLAQLELFPVRDSKKLGRSSSLFPGLGRALPALSPADPEPALPLDFPWSPVLPQQSVPRCLWRFRGFPLGCLSPQSLKWTLKCGFLNFS